MWRWWWERRWLVVFFHSTRQERKNWRDFEGTMVEQYPLLFWRLLWRKKFSEQGYCRLCRNSLATTTTAGCSSGGTQDTKKAVRMRWGEASSLLSLCWREMSAIDATGEKGRWWRRRRRRVLSYNKILLTNVRSYWLSLTPLASSLFSLPVLLFYSVLVSPKRGERSSWAS